MRIFHTSDWHLGQKLLSRDREEEHSRALQWLCDAIEEHKPDVLLISGDVFDIGNPTNVSRRLYFEHLLRLVQSGCRHVVITAGNHDSPSMLEAPRSLLRRFQVHIVGEAPTSPEEELLILKDQKGQPEAVIAAVPFLRDRDLRYAVPGEGSLDRIQRIRDALAAHFKRLGERVSDWRSAGIPIIAMGHLYARGATAAEGQDNIYIGDVANIGAEDFPEVFDYVALGHLHRPQLVGGQSRIRYSGSLIPLSFSEHKDDKGLWCVDFEKGSLSKVEFIRAPLFRRLKTIKGNLAEVKEKIKAFAERHREDLRPWLDVVVESPGDIPGLDEDLRAFTAELHLELLKLRIASLPSESEKGRKAPPDLQTLDALEVFELKCRADGISAEDMDELIMTFRELLGWMQEQEEFS